MIQYPLGATCFTAQQCQKIQTKYLPTFLSHMGINRTMATAVQHSPLHLGGFNVFNLETEQGVMKTKMVLSNLWQNDEVGKMLQISHKHLQLQASIPWLVMSRLGFQQRKYVEPCYLSNLWEFMDDINTNMQFEFDQWLYPQWQHDTFIIDLFSNLPGITKKELIHAQWCRLYLGATTMANICTSNGWSICNWAFNGQDHPRQSTFYFPQQSCTSTLVWKTWHHLLQLCYCHGTLTKLNTPLGEWYRGWITQDWNSVIDPHTSHIYIWDNGTIHIYEWQGCSIKQYWYLWPHTMPSFPIECVSISGYFLAGTFITNGYVKITAPPES